MKRSIYSEHAPKATGPFSQAIIKENLIFTSGQIHLTPQGELLEVDIDKQTHQVMKNLKAILEEAGVMFDDVVKTTIYVTDMDDYAKVNDVYGSYFSEPFPAREVICVKGLPLGARIEISMVAIKP